MKKILTALALTAASGLSFAGSGAGCGAGSMIFEGQSGVGPHILAATTNGVLGNQTFGMSSGSLGCDTSKPIQSMALFMDNNIDKIARDVSRGEGENLDALAVILGIEAQHRDHFAQLLQQNFATIFPNESVTASAATDSMRGILQADQVLSQYI